MSLVPVVAKALLDSYAQSVEGHGGHGVHCTMEQLALSPQCGFSGTAHGNDIAVEAQRAKLQLGIETVREVWGDC